MNKKFIFVSLAVAIIFLVCGFFIAKKLNPCSICACDKDLIYKSGWNAAVKRFKDSGIFDEATNSAIKSLSGNILEISNNNIKIKLININPMADPDLDIRNIKLNQNTKIFSIVKKDESEYKKEMDLYLKNISNITNNLDNPANNNLEPSRNVNKEIDKSGLKANMQIIVEANDDIRTKKEFEAYKIIIQP